MSKKTNQLKTLKNCLGLERTLNHKDSRDIDANELCNKLQAISRRISRERHFQKGIVSVIKL